MKKFFKNFTLILLLIFSSKTIFCMDEQTTCKSEHTYPNLNIDGLPQEALINIVLQLLEDGETVKDGLDNVKNFFLTNKSINNELKEYFWNNIHKELFEIYNLIIKYIENILDTKNRKDLIALGSKSIINAIEILNEHSEKNNSLLSKIFANKITKELSRLKEFKSETYPEVESNIIFFIFFYKDMNFLELTLQKYPPNEEDFEANLENVLIFKNKPAIKLLVEKYKTKISRCHLFTAIEQGDYESFNYLFKKSIYSQDIEEFKHCFTYTCLYNALENLDIFKLLINHIRSLDIDIVDKQKLLNTKAEGFRPGLMQKAINNKNIKQIQTILDNSDLIILKQEDLLQAIKTKNKNLINLLLTNEFFQAECDYLFFLGYCKTDANAKAFHALAEEQRLFAEKEHSRYLDYLNTQPEEKASYLLEPIDIKWISMWIPL